MEIVESFRLIYFCDMKVTGLNYRSLTWLVGYSAGNKCSFKGELHGQEVGHTLGRLLVYPMTSKNIQVEIPLAVNNNKGEVKCYISSVMQWSKSM